MRIALLGNFGTRNFGNDASLEAMIDGLRVMVPDAELTCICPKPEVVRERYGIAALGINLPVASTTLQRTIERITLGYSRRICNVLAPFWLCRGYDVVMVPGTGILDDYRDRPRGWPFMLLRWSLAARVSGAKLGFVSIGAGPILHPLSRQLMKWAAQLCSFRSFRDTCSRDFVRTMGIDVSDDHVTPDLGLRLPTTAPARGYDARSATTIGLGVMTYHGWVTGAKDDEIYASYLLRLTRLTLQLGERGHRVRLLMGDASDTAVAEELLRAIRKSLQGGIPPWLSFKPAMDIHDVLRQIGECDVVVAVRYHNIIAALIQERPTMSLEYADKNAAVLGTFGLGGFCHHIEHFEVDTVLSDIDQLLAERERYSALVAERLAGARAALERQDRILAERLLRSPHAEASSGFPRHRAGTSP